MHWMHCSLRASSSAKRDLIRGNEALGTIELVLIIVVLISLVVIFRDRIKNVLDAILKKIEKSAKSV